VHALPSEDYVNSLPGANFTNLYSGYLDINHTGRYMHYLFILADENLPLILWLNGGPGCSSMAGMFTEIGPYIFDNETLIPNPHSWDQSANLLFLESPTIVGFSINPVPL
jgi:cathepsin A (carboxypeptidase C)/serine carboxypeptidase-like clade 2